MAMCASASSVWQQEARCGETAGAEHLMFTLSMCQKLPPWTSFGPARQPEYPSAAVAHWGAPKAGSFFVERNHISYPPGTICGVKQSLIINDLLQQRTSDQN